MATHVSQPCATAVEQEANRIVGTTFGANLMVVLLILGGKSETENCFLLFPVYYGTIAKTRAGKPEPPLGLGKVTTTTAWASGTLSRFVSSSIW